MNSTLALVMIVKDEASVLERCLESVLNLVDEIVIVDTGSTDNTKDIARNFNARIFDYVWEQDFSSARNYALSQVKSNWCIVLDADEMISNDCMQSIRSFINSHEAIGKVKIINKFLGSDGLNYEQIYISRLFPSHCRYTGKIHEQIDSDLPRKIIDIEIQHDGYLEKKKSSRNIPILKKVIEENPQDPYYYYQIAKEYRGLDEHLESNKYLEHAYSLMNLREPYAPRIIIDYLYSMINSNLLHKGLDVIEDNRDFLWDNPDFFFVSGLYLLEVTLSDPEQFISLLPLIEKYYLRALEIGDSNSEGSVLGTGSFAAHHNLGVYYEATGELPLAKEQYEQAAKYNYEPSIERMKNLLI
ncbi:glycosyltransferase family 2 protein [Paenibacillus sp. FSL H7-0326]|uniref:tetratricopeptide repeat-containing glycosyltransferase family 2 protein n=1 Tax=Paenibacillus sp. FSL H7-0326 TaxID=1921144 RepID=UPI0009FA2890|nr:glycosyltransferase family 2 protein [Paenibacillus sp. FSL H7-0326]